MLDLAGHQDQADLVIIADGAQREQGGNLGDHIALALHDGAKRHAGAGVHEQDDGQLALLDIALDERMPHAGGDVPVDGANFVAGLIFAHLLEGNAGPLEDAAVGAAERVLDGPARPQLQAADLTHDCRGLA